MTSMKKISPTIVKRHPNKMPCMQWHAAMQAAAEARGVEIQDLDPELIRRLSLKYRTRSAVKP